MSTATLPSTRTTARPSPSSTVLERRHPLAVGGAVVGLGLLWLQIWLVGISLVLWIVTGWSPTVITGGSMAPTLPAGQLVLVDDSRLVDIGVNDIVVFDRPGSEGALVTHRVVEIDASGALTTRGDANNDPDSTPVTDETVHGRVRVVVPFVGLPRVWLERGQYVRLALFGALDLVLLAACSRVLRRDPDDGHLEPPTAPVSAPWGPPTGLPVTAGAP